MHHSSHGQGRDREQGVCLQGEEDLHPEGVGQTPLPAGTRKVGTTHPTGMLSCWQKNTSNAMADPGFPRGGGANSPGGAQTYNFAKFSQKLHEIERIWTPGGAHPKFYYVDPPLE